MSLAKIFQPENEFCQYLNAFSNSRAKPVDGNIGNYKPSGNKIRSIFPERKQNEDVMQNPFELHQRLDIPTPSALRSRPANTNVSTNNGKSARKSARKQKHLGRQKPRWLLSNQNMGKRAMETQMITIDQNVLPMQK